MLVDYLGDWLPATVIWRYVEMCRPRVLLRLENPAGLAVRQLRWAEQLNPTGRILVVDLREMTPEEARAGNTSPGSQNWLGAP